jgi:predicted AAA+ superfamily ATPase
MRRRIVFEELKEIQQSQLWRIIVLTGARQTGKTTAVRNAMSDYAYLAIDDMLQNNDLAKLKASQWAALYPKAALDEVQKIPSLVDSVKAVYDQFPQTRYALLGSSQFLLLEKIRESLAGRCFIMEMYPLTLPELRTKNIDDNVEKSFFVTYLNNEENLDNRFPIFTLDPKYAEKKNAYDFYLQFGGYPVLTHEDITDAERYQWLENYVRTYLERDIRDLAAFRDLEPFVKLQLYLANVTGNLINYSSIAKETGITVPTVQRYVQYMNVNYQTILLPAWYANPIKRLVKAPKIHFLDGGVLRAILQKRGAMTGNEFESAIIAEIYKQIKTYRLPLRCYHFRTLDGREIDLLLEGEDYFIAIEVKMTENVTKIDAKHFNGLQDFLTKPLKHCFVLSNDNEIKHFGDNITAMHAADFLG